MSDAKQYIESLQSFSKSIEHLINSLEKNFKDKTQSSEELISNSKEYYTVLLDNAKKLTIIEQEVKTNKEQTKSILDILKSRSRKDKKDKKGILEKLGAKDKSKGVIDGIKHMVTIAAGITAIGSAFKLVGEVDFKSVLALSTALPLVAYAYQKAGENGPKSVEDSILIGLGMVAMSGALLGSGYILSQMPNIGIMQLISSIGVAAAMGIVMYGMGKLVQEGMTPKTILGIYSLIPILPLIAGSLYLSSEWISQVKGITLDQIINIASVGIGLGAALIPLAAAGRVVGPHIKNLLLISEILPIVSASLLLSSAFLYYMPELNHENVIKNSAAIGLAMTPMIGAMWLMNKSKLGIKEVALGTLSMTIMSAGLMVMSHILSVGNYGNYPSVKWAEGVGLSMLGYLPAVLITGGVAATGIGAIVMGLGIASMLAISGGLVGTSKILAKGTYKKGPTKEWAEGVSTALLGFVTPLMMLQGGLASMIFGPSMSEKIKMIETIGEGLKEVSFTIQGGSYSGGPSKEWAEGVGISLLSFASTLEKLDGGWFGPGIDEQIQNMIKVAGSLHKIGIAVGKDQSVYQGGPKEEWAKGVGGSVLAFAQSFAVLDDEMSISKFKEWVAVFPHLSTVMSIFARNFNNLEFKNFPSDQWSNGVISFVKGFTQIKGMNNMTKVSKGINQIADSYGKLAKNLSIIAQVTKNIKQNDVPNLGGLYSGLITLSLIDNNNLKLVLDNIDKNESSFEKTLMMIKAKSSGNDIFAMIRAMQQQVKGGKGKTVSDNSGMPKEDNTSSDFGVVGGGNPKKEEIIINTVALETKVQELTNLTNRVVQLLSEISQNTSVKQTNFSIGH